MKFEQSFSFQLLKHLFKSYPKADMKNFILLIFIVFVLSTNSLAQWKRETGFELGINQPIYPKNYYDGKINGSLKCGAYQSWFNPETKFTFRPMVGLNLERLRIDYLSRGGLGGGNTFEGTIWSINGEIDALAQIRILKKLFFSVGPAGKFLLTNVSKLSTNWWQHGVGNGGNEINGFNRENLHQPSIGIKIMLLDRNTDKKITYGFSFKNLWRSPADDFVDYSNSLEVSFYMGLH